MIRRAELIDDIFASDEIECFPADVGKIIDAAADAVVEYLLQRSEEFGHYAVLRAAFIESAQTIRKALHE